MLTVNESNLWERLTSWTGKSTHGRILSAGMIVAGFTLLAKTAGVAKELVVAGHFGTSDALDAFLIAFIIPSFAASVMAGSLNASLIPTFIEVREKKGKEAALRLLSGVLGWGTAVAAVISIVFALSGGYLIPLVGSNFDASKLETTRSLFYILLPILFFSNVSSIGASILNAEERFALAAVVPIVTPAITVLSLIFLGQRLGIYVLALSILAGFAFEALLLLWGLFRRGLVVRPRLHRMDEAMRQVAKQCMPMAAGVFLMGSTTLIDQAMAAMLGPGSVSILNYGTKVVAFVLGIASVAVSTAVFPRFSQMVAAGDWDSIRKILRVYVCTVLLASIPITALLVVFSEPLVRILFERGAFTASDTTEVAQVQAMYVLQVGFFLCGVFFVRLISAMKGNAILMLCAMISLPLNVFLNYVLMRYMGVSGIALSTSLVYVFSSVFVSLASYRILRGREQLESRHRAQNSL
jgi:putative peptidoglycan lipid II flippase